MATRLLSPDGACEGVTVPFGRGRRYAGTTVDVSDTSHVRALRAAGYTVADISGAPSRDGGFECTECAFRAYFKTCSRCGGACERLSAT